MNFSDKNGITSLRFLSRAHELVLFEPVYLLASLRTVLNRLRNALGTGIVGNELLVKLFTLTVIQCRTIDRVLLILPDILQWTLVVGTLTHVDHFGIRRIGYLLDVR